ncbi:KilA-N domain-containing protein [Escherichia coli]|nr:KilA-N domain-containing protein [Escherichia coli]
MIIVPLKLQRRTIRFSTDGWINATDICKTFPGSVWITSCQRRSYQEYVKSSMDEVYSGEPSKILQPPVIPGMHKQAGTRGQGWWYVATSKTFELHLPVGCDARLLWVRPAH